LPASAVRLLPVEHRPDAGAPGMPRRRIAKARSAAHHKR
jgi:hypothetical protein